MPEAPFGIVRLTGHPCVPKGQRSTSYTLSASDDPEFAARIAAVLDETQVNGLVSLRDYIAILEAEDDERLAEIRAQGDPSRAQEWIMSLWREGAAGKVYQFWLDGDRYSGTRVEELRSFLVQRGSQIQSSPAPYPGRAQPDLASILALDPPPPPAGS